MPSKKSNFYLTREELIREIIASKKKHRESNFPRSPAECFTPKLTEYLQLMVNRYANKGQWRGYSYIEDMKSDALLTLCQNAFKYNEEKYDNPFGYYTQIIKYCFITFLEKEELIRDIKDSIWESIGMTPSYARQIRNEMLKDVADQSNKGIKALKRDTEALNVRVNALGAIIAKVNRLKNSDEDIDRKIAEILEIEPQAFTGDLDHVHALFDQVPNYQIDAIVIDGCMMTTLSVIDEKTKSSTKRVIDSTSNTAIIIALCAIALTIRRDLWVKKLRDLSGYNITATRMPTAEKSINPEAEFEVNEGSYAQDPVTSPKKRTRRKTTE